jgi:hypothetical protein
MSHSYDWTIGLVVIVGKLLAPQLVTFVATKTPLLTLLALWYPWLSTLLLLHQKSNDDSEEAIPPVASTEAIVVTTTAEIIPNDKENHDAEERPSFRPFPKTNPTAPSRRGKRQSIDAPATPVRRSSRLREAAEQHVTRLYQQPTATSRARQRKPQQPRRTALATTPPGVDAYSSCRPPAIAPPRRNPVRRKNKTVDSVPSLETVSTISSSSSSLSENNTPAPMLPEPTQRGTADLEFWVDYWILFGCTQCIRRMVSCTPVLPWLLMHPRLRSIWRQAEFLVFLACLLHSMPYGQSRHVSPSRQPVRFIVTQWIGPYVCRITTAVSNIVSPAVWNSAVMEYVNQLLSVLTMLKLLSNDKAQLLTELVQHHVRPMLLPGLILLVPLIRPFGILYVQYALPMSLSYTAMSSTDTQPPKERAQVCLNQLEYWTMHAVLDGCLGFLDKLLRSNVLFRIFHWCLSWLLIPATAVLWWILSWQSHAIFVHYFYPELVLLGLLPSKTGNGATASESRTVRLLSWIWDNLPRAVDPVMTNAPLLHQQEEDQNGS